MSFIPLAHLVHVAQNMGPMDSPLAYHCGMALSDPQVHDFFLGSYNEDFNAEVARSLAREVRDACMGLRPRQCELWRERRGETGKKQQQLGFA